MALGLLLAGGLLSAGPGRRRRPGGVRFGGRAGLPHAGQWPKSPTGTK